MKRHSVWEIQQLFVCSALVGWFCFLLDRVLVGLILFIPLVLLIGAEYFDKP